MTDASPDLKQWQQPELIQRALAKKRVAVVGLSSNELRPSNFVGYYLHRNGYEVTPVNPRETEIFGLEVLPEYHRTYRTTSTP